MIGNQSLNCDWIAKLDEARMTMMNEYQERINEAENKSHELEKSMENCFDLTQRNDGLIRVNNEQRIECEEFKKQIEELKESNANSLQKIEDLKADNEELLAENEDLAPRVEAFKTESAGLKTGIEDLKTQNKDLKTQNEDLKTQNEDLKTQNEDLKTRNVDLKMKLKVSTETINKYG